MTDFQKITEADSLYRHLEKMKVKEILESINKEDRKVPQIVQAAIPQIEALVMVIADKMLAGGRLFYSGFGAVEEKYACLKWNRLPFYLKWMKK